MHAGSLLIHCDQVWEGVVVERVVLMHNCDDMKGCAVRTSGGKLIVINTRRQCGMSGMQ